MEKKNNKILLIALCAFSLLISVKLYKANAEISEIRDYDTCDIKELEEENYALKEQVEELEQRLDEIENQSEESEG